MVPLTKEIVLKVDHIHGYVRPSREKTTRFYIVHFFICQVYKTLKINKKAT